jgi:hypothetical protein
LFARVTKDIWPESTGRILYKRSLYIHQQRRLTYPPMAIFDLPSAAQSCTRRERSNTPLQALNLLNDPAFLECARGMATRVLQHPAASLADQVDYAFRIAVGRSPRPSESASARKYFEDRINLLRKGSPTAEQFFPSHALRTDPFVAAAWVGLSRVLMNLDEFITRE